MLSPASPIIDHIGVLVPDLEKGAAEWSRVLGYTFTPVARYKSTRYQDFSDSCKHLHDTRFVFSRGGSPRIELLEVTGSGSHGPDRAGLHHLAITRIEDLESDEAEARRLGLSVEARNTDEQDRLLLFFTHLMGVPLEFVSTVPGPVTAEDGSALPVDPVTGRPSILHVPGDLKTEGYRL